MADKPPIGPGLDPRGKPSLHTIQDGAFFLPGCSTELRISSASASHFPHIN